MNEAEQKEDRRIALIVHHPNTFNALIEPICHTLKPNERLVFLKDGIQKKLVEREEGHYYPDDSLATEHIVSHFATLYDVIFMFGESTHIEYLESPPEKGTLTVRGDRHLELRRGHQKFNIISGYDLEELLESFKEHDKSMIQRN